MKVLTTVSAVALVLAASVSMGCSASEWDANAGDNESTEFFTPRVTIPAGTAITVRLASTLSSQTARVGDSWSGEVVRPVIVDERVVVPAGSPVRGVLASVEPAAPGSRATLDLQVRSVTANGRRRDVMATAEPVVAGSTRARNLGAGGGVMTPGIVMTFATSETVAMALEIR